jgi:tagaturonate reductase
MQPRLTQSLLNLPRPKRERILQMGEGNFLRAFLDWMIHVANQRGLYDGGIVVVQPRAGGKVRTLVEQDGLYTLIVRGIENGEPVDRREVVSSVLRGIDPYTDFADFLACASNPDLRFVFSNTTEAGIVYREADRISDHPALSFPGKIAQLLIARFKAFNGDPAAGLVFIPCELIEQNGAMLREHVLRHARVWNAGAGCLNWIERANIFCNTLVDRIVSAFPAGEAGSLREQFGYDDRAMTVAEPYHALVIEGPRELAEELPLHRAGLNVIWTDDVRPYRLRKVRLLNGGHSMIALAGFLIGKRTVRDCMEDADFSTLLNRGLAEEIIPALDLPADDLKAFAAAVHERFANPFLDHALLSIAMNATSKFRVRLIPTLKEYHRKTGHWPPLISFCLGALIAFSRGEEIRDGALIGHVNGNEYRIEDEPSVLAAWQRAWEGDDAVLKRVQRMLSETALWDENLSVLPGLANIVAVHLGAILDNGMDGGLDRLLGR